MRKEQVRRLINEIDKISGFLDKGTYNYVKPKQGICNNHATFKFVRRGVWLTITSKFYTQRDLLPKISKDNINYYVEELAKQKGIITTAETLLNIPIYWLDVKKDVPVTNPSEMLSYMRELAYQSTSKNEIISFVKDLGFEQSLLIKSSCKTVKDSLCIYTKTDEIYAHRAYDWEYYNNFSSDFLYNNRNLLRFERRLQNAKAIKKAIRWDKKEPVRLIDIFKCPYNIVGEKVKQVFNVGE